MARLDEMAKEPAKERKQARVEAEIEQIEAALKNGHTYADITATLFGETVKPGTFATMLWRARRKHQKREAVKATTQAKPAKKPAAAPQKRERQRTPEPEPEQDGETPAQIRQRLIKNEPNWDFHAAPERQQRLCRYRSQQAHGEYLGPSVDDLPPPWSKQPFEPDALDETWYERWSDRLTTDAKYTLQQLRKADDWRDVHFALNGVTGKKKASVNDMKMIQHPNVRTMFEESKPLAKQ